LGGERDRPLAPVGKIARSPGPLRSQRPPDWFVRARKSIELNSFPAKSSWIVSDPIAEIDQESMHKATMIRNAARRLTITGITPPIVGAASVRGRASPGLREIKAVNSRLICRCRRESA